jgi:hypothetical protein
MKAKNGSVLHQFHSRREHLRSLISLLVEEEVQLQEDLNSTCAKLETAANLRYVRYGCQGTPTLLSSSQIVHLCKKKSLSQKGKDTSATEDGGTDDIYKFLEESGN